MTRPSTAAFFDVDGTIVAGNIVRHYANLWTQEMTPAGRALWTLLFALRVPYYWALDRVSRARFQRVLYRNYRRFSPAELEVRARRYFETDLASRLFPAAMERIGEHQRCGDRVVLVTGSLRTLVAPVAAQVRASDLLAPELEQRDGAFTGELAGAPLAGELKGEAVGDYVARHDLDPAACHAYADSFDDLPMLRRVGHVHVVNPAPRLARVARRAGWEIARWERG